MPILKFNLKTIKEDKKNPAKLNQWEIANHCNFTVLYLADLKFLYGGGGGGGGFSHLIETDERDFYIPAECPPFFSKFSEFFYFSKIVN